MCSSLIIQTGLQLLYRQDHTTKEFCQVEETYRDPHGNKVRFSVLLHKAPMHLRSYAKAERYVGGAWQPLTQMFQTNLPGTTGEAMMWLLASSGAILDWPALPELGLGLGKVRNSDG